jgi:hypothetical protein
MRRIVCAAALILLSACSMNIRLVFEAPLDSRRLEEKLEAFEREIRGH